MVELLPLGKLLTLVALDQRGSLRKCADPWLTLLHLRGRVRRLEVEDLEIHRLHVQVLVIDAEEPAHIVLRAAELAPPAPRLEPPGGKRTRPARQKPPS
jgi:hypothetical protein